MVRSRYKMEMRNETKTALAPRPQSRSDDVAPRSHANVGVCSLGSQRFFICFCLDGFIIVERCDTLSSSSSSLLLLFILLFNLPFISLLPANVMLIIDNANEKGKT